MNAREHEMTIDPGATIGILGGGQLGRMLALAAARLGYRCRVYDPAEQCPAGDVAPHVSAGWDDEDALAAFAAAVDVVTLEFENVPVAAVAFLATRVPVRPGAGALEVAQDRAVEKDFLNRAGVETAPWATVESLEDLHEALDRLGRPAVLKTARFGYDGKGQAVIRDGDDPAAAWAAVGEQRCVLEGFVDFMVEVSVLAARTAGGAIACFEPVENRHRDGILHKTRIPAPITPDVAERAVEVACRAVSRMDYVGLLAVEMFVMPDGRILANEIAPRPHNSGHWTIDGAATSQFEQTVRAICGQPLGDTGRLGAAEMTNLIGAEVEDWPALLAEPGARLHLYGKAETRPGRKMGHVTRVWPGRDAPPED
ncbi:5-(carboxyamino)imidazole ribonucleotide synthase [Marivibrio halodurans]|uniref:N5-carboxyaminoimidazole ribonucleotide synthase n=2 Tax=Marivibrio halodurans TaxID=2039722 RepID=A0A8J7V0Q8_9PROT|nr:5-(carboxyamino)imidazole ribonucleotide synthase [Marivibrio halodurans]